MRTKETERLIFLALCAWNNVPPTSETKAALSPHQRAEETQAAWERVVNAIRDELYERSL